MDYQAFATVLNYTIFENTKADLLRKLAENPERYIGLFRPTLPKAKLMQNLLQSHEIRFGDAFEKLVGMYLNENNYKPLTKRLLLPDGVELNVDQLHKYDNQVIFIEQKVRDDHDSTKKRGQLDNFEKKLNAINSAYSEFKVKGFMYFIDPTLVKNRGYYSPELQRMSQDYGVELNLVYGAELFSTLNLTNTWVELENHLRLWRTNIPELPELNFDAEAESSFNEIKNLSPAIYRKLLNNREICDEILPILFPQKLTLLKLAEYFSSKNQTIYNSLREMIVANCFT